MRHHPTQSQEGKDVASSLPATGGHFDPSETLTSIAANPSSIAAIAPRLWDNIPTTSTTASTIVSTIGLAIGTPVAAKGAARKIRQTSRTNRPVRAGFLNRSCQIWIDLCRLPSGIKLSRDRGAAIGYLDPSSQKTSGIVLKG
jgi:hypothetical protein